MDVRPGNVRESQKMHACCKNYCFSYYAKSAILNPKLSKLAASFFLYRKLAERYSAGLSGFWSKKVFSD